jgi:hypothetical protein
MGTIAERFVCGMTAAAEPNGRPTCQAKWLAIRIKNLELAFDADGTVVIDSDLCGRHLFS